MPRQHTGRGDRVLCGQQSGGDRQSRASARDRRKAGFDRPEHAQQGGGAVRRILRRIRRLGRAWHKDVHRVCGGLSAASVPPVLSAGGGAQDGAGARLRGLCRRGKARQKSQRRHPGADRRRGHRDLYAQRRHDGRAEERGVVQPRVQCLSTQSACADRRQAGRRQRRDADGAAAVSHVRAGRMHAHYALRRRQGGADAQVRRKGGVQAVSPRRGHLHLRRTQHVRQDVGFGRVRQGADASAQILLLRRGQAVFGHKGEVRAAGGERRQRGEIV